MNVPDNDRANQECEKCVLSPGGIILVENINDPHCISCGRKLVILKKLTISLPKDE